MKRDRATAAARHGTRLRATIWVLAGAVTSLLSIALGLHAVIGGVVSGPGAASTLGDQRSCALRPDDCGSGTREDGGSIVLGLVGRLRPADPEVSSAVLAMVVPSPFVVLPSGATRHNRDLLISEPALVSSRPQVVVYKIRARARWNDGMPISAADYILHWRTHTATGCPRCSPDEVAGYSQIAAVAGSDNGKTVTVTFASEYPRWRALFCHLLPAHQAVQRFPVPASVPGGAPAGGPRVAPPPPWVADFSGGPYRVTAVREDQVELAANPRWYGGWAPTLDRVIFRLFRDQASAAVAAARGELDGLRVPVVAGTPARIQRLAGMGFTSQVSTGGRPTVLAISPRYVNIRDNNAPGGVFTADAERWGVAAAR